MIFITLLLIIRSQFEKYQACYPIVFYQQSYQRLMPFKESKQFWRSFTKYPGVQEVHIPDVEKHCLNSVLSNTPKNNPKAVIDHIDSFCQKHWMMNLGSQKAEIVKATLQKYNPKNILEIGTYCGYSSITMAFHSKAIIHAIDPNPKFVEIAKQMHKHAGLQDRIIIHQGIIQSEVNTLKKEGPFDLIFIDHVKQLYLPDFKFLESEGLIRKGTVIVADNIIYPGSPDYLEHFKKNDLYDSTLYHSYVQYSDIPDAILVSQRIAE